MKLPRIFSCSALLLLGMAFFSRSNEAFAVPAQNPESAKAQDVEQADDLFAQEEWLQARTLYDAAFEKANNSEKRHIATQAFQCSIRLKEWDESLRRAVEFRQTSKLGIWTDHFYWPRDEELQKLTAQVKHLEQSRNQLLEIRKALQGDIPKPFAKRLDAEAIDVDFEMLRVLDPDNIRPREYYGWDSGYENIDWWWEGVESAYEGRRHWRYREAAPVDGEKNLIFLETPDEYSPDLTRAGKILFLFKEIQNLDRSDSKEHFARTLLHRADIARRLFGPIKVPSWVEGVSYYQYANRPSFKGEQNGVKAIFDLEDNESKLVLNGDLSVVTLPESESPIALWRRIEESFPGSGLVAEAKYRRALYHQNRRQYSKAKALYREIMDDHPLEQEKAGVADTQIESIDSADVLLGDTKIYSAGDKPKLWFASRNTKTVEFTAYKVDMKSYILDREKAGDWYELAYVGFNIYDEWNEDSKELEPFVAKQFFAKWKQAVPLSDKVETNSTLAPLDRSGTYVVKANVPGKNTGSKAIVIVSEIAIVQKRLPGKALIWIVDSTTGRPLADHPLKLVSEDGRHAWKTLTTDREGVVTSTDESDAFVFAETNKGDIAFMNIEGVYKGNIEHSVYSEFGITDRPLYRPGEEISFRIWTRQMRGNRNYELAKAGEKVEVHLYGPYGPNNDRVKSISLDTDESGSASGSFRLDAEAPLGQYGLKLGRPEDRWSPDIGQFRIEEYKKPEYEVMVTAASKKARLGELAKAKIDATYYTGEPVAEGAVEYQVYRQTHSASYAPPTKWDWLYGNGFGNYSWLYPWLGDPAPVEQDPYEDEWQYYYSSETPRDLVASGKTALNEDGAAEISIDTSEFKTTSDHRITIEATVRDESRRSIKGSGQFVVARQPYSAVLNLDREWYQPGSTVTTQVNTLTADERATALSGTLELFRVTSKKAPDGSLKFKKEELQTFAVETDEQGSTVAQFALKSPGLYRLRFASDGPDAIFSERTIWCHGPGFDGTKYRYGALEIIPDRRMYAVGDTAKLLIHTSQPNTRLLLNDSMDKQQFIDIESHCKVVEIPILEEHVPNFFFDATVVHSGEVFHEYCELFVPPVSDMLNMELTTESSIYRPGDTGKVSVKVTDSDGKPVSGSMALRGFDKSITYIQPETKFRPKSLVSDRRLEYWDEKPVSTLNSQRFGVSGRFTCPEYHLDDGTEPEMGGMGGAPPTGGTMGRNKRSTSSRRASAPGPSSEGYFDKQLKEPKVRSNFADSAIWIPNLELDKDGTAQSEIVFPDSLTTWRIQGFLATNKTQVGEATIEVKTKKDLMVRLQSPRFVTEGDEVTLSAIVQNQLDQEKDVSVELALPESGFEVVEPETATPKANENGNRLLSASQRIKPGGTHRFDWPVKVRGSENATLLVKALTESESDAMSLELPAYSRTVKELKALSGFVAVEDPDIRKLDFELPQNVNPSTTEIELTFAPTAASAAFDALPFLAGYPYGCVEQTMSRFYPTVLATHTMRKLGIDPEKIANRVVDRKKRLAKRKPRLSLFNSKELERMAQSGLNRLSRFQHKDGGWGWWENDKSSPFMTAYVLTGLDTAANSGVKISESAYRRGVRYLLWPGDSADTSPSDLTEARNKRAFVAYALSLARSNDDADYRPRIRQRIEKVYRSRNALTPYGKALLILALHNKKMKEEANTLCDEVVNRIQTDTKSNTSWIPTSGKYWRWYHNDVETNAWVLRVLIALDKDKELLTRIANWLVAQRRAGLRWRSTRDSALAVHALSEYMLKMKQSANDYSVAVHLDGKFIKDVDVNWNSMLAMENRISIQNMALAPGSHQISLTRNGNTGTIHYAMAYNYETHYDKIPAASNGGLEIDRKYFSVSGKDSKPLNFGDQISVGDTVEVELTVSSSGDFEYLAFEDPKPAGCEPTRLRSGYGRSGMVANVELRDSKVIFFVEYLRKGTHTLKYKLRAVNPGTFSAMPSTGFAMYAPEINARGEEMQITIVDRNQ